MARRPTIGPSLLSVGINSVRGDHDGRRCVLEMCVRSLGRPFLYLVNLYVVVLSPYDLLYGEQKENTSLPRSLSHDFPYSYVSEGLKYDTARTVSLKSEALTTAQDPL